MHVHFILCKIPLFISLIIRIESHLCLQVQIHGITCHHTIYVFYVCEHQTPAGRLKNCINNSEEKNT